MSLHVSLTNRAPALDFHASLPLGAMSVLLGASGAGKTSVLRALAGLLRADQACVRVGEQIWDDSAQGIHLPTRQRGIGLVPQRDALFPHLKAQQNVEMALRHLPPAARRTRAQACLALAQVSECAEALPDALSGGQRQRVALARAIARDPAVLLLDEPFSALDRTTRKRLQVELKRLHAELGMTVVLVTHDLEEAAALASHLCLLQGGRVLQAGPTREVLNQPASEDAARLLDIANIFDGEAVGTAEGTTLRWGPHTLTVPSGTTTSGRVRWAIQPASVLMVRPDKPWSARLENPVPVRVAEKLELGADVLVWLEPDGLAPTRLQMRLPLRALQRHPVQVGDALTVCLPGSDLMLFNTPE